VIACSSWHEAKLIVDKNRKLHCFINVDIYGHIFGIANTALSDVEVAMIEERLRQARLVACLTQAEAVAKLAAYGISLTTAGLSKYERGGSVPPPALLLKLAKVYAVKPRYFLSEPGISIAWYAFRMHASLGQRRQERIKALAAESIAGQLWLLEKLYPDREPNFPKAWRVNTGEEAEKAANLLREKWGLGNSPIGSVTQTIESKLGVVCECDIDIDEFDGLSGLANDRFPVMVTALKMPDDRKRFNLSHELGHLVMDCASLDDKVQESLAHRFAGAFIVPADVVRAELGQKRKHLSFAELAELKRKHGMSMQAWLRRAWDLAIISDNRYQELCIQFSKKGWRKNEPVEYHGNESPKMLLQMTLRALVERIITPEKADSLCPGVTEQQVYVTEQPEGMHFSAEKILKLPRKERKKILALAAEILKEDYEKNTKLTAFEAFQDEEQ
jgi:Zn-dependent peptidase ImmA (M78 family)/transcriptional regulator with XRE-family HTH domain